MQTMFTRDHTEMLTRTPADIDQKMRIKTKQLQVKFGPCQVGGQTRGFKNANTRIADYS